MPENPLKKRKVNHEIKDDNYITVNMLSSDEEEIPEFHDKNILHHLTFPMGKEVFMKEYFQKKAFVSINKSNNPLERFQQLIDMGLYSLNIKDMLDNTPSDTISAWVKSDKGNISMDIFIFIRYIPYII